MGEEDAVLTSADAARYLGVSITSIKRWADVGLLPCAKTAGKHRRFERRALDAFRLRLETTEAANVNARVGEDVWGHLLGSGSELGVVSWLYGVRDRLGSWWRVAEALGPVIEELGARWARGEISVFDEHIASERLARGLARVSGELSPPPSAPHALLVTADGDDHTLGLALVELVLREQGFRTIWLGRRTPTPELIAAIDHHRASLVCVSASVHSQDEDSLKAQARKLAVACRVRGATLLLGGKGLWPPIVPSAQVVRDLARLQRIAQELRARV